MATLSKVIGIDELRAYTERLNFDPSTKEFKGVMFRSVGAYRSGLVANIRNSKHNKRRGTLPLTVNRRIFRSGGGSPAVVIGLNNRTKQAIAQADRYIPKAIVPNPAWVDAGTAERFTKSGNRRGRIIGDSFITSYRDANMGRLAEEFTQGIARFLERL